MCGAIEGPAGVPPSGRGKRVTNASMTWLGLHRTVSEAGNRLISSCRVQKRQKGMLGEHSNQLSYKIVC
jgi:hypothetical protein